MTQGSSVEKWAVQLMSYATLCSVLPRGVVDALHIPLLYHLQRVLFALSAGVHPATSFCTDTSSTPISSPPAVSVDTTSEGTTNQSRTRSRSKNKDLHAKRGASPLTSVSSTRRSPRFAVSAAYHPLGTLLDIYSLLSFDSVKNKKIVFLLMYEDAFFIHRLLMQGVCIKQQTKTAWVTPYDAVWLYQFRRPSSY